MFSCLAHKQGIQGVALVMTLAILAMIAISLVAFFSSAMLNMKASRAYWEKERAEQAVDAGIAHAIAGLESAVADRRNFVTAQFPSLPTPGAELSPVLLLSRDDEDIRKQPYPLISHAIPLAEFENNIAATDAWDSWIDIQEGTAAPGFTKLRDLRLDWQQSIDLNTFRQRVLDDTNVSGIPADHYLRAPFIEIEDSQTGQVTARFAYIFLDEQARFAPLHHRGEPIPAPDSFETSNRRIPLYHGGTELSEEERARIPDMEVLPPSFSSPALLFGQGSAARDRWREVMHLYTGMRTWNEEVIPAGYPSSGKPKYNINDLATNEDHGATAEERAEAIAEIIDEELPNFKSRDPSLPPEEGIRYLNRIAASIVDYIDQDDQITFANETEPAGRDLFPLVTTIAERLKWSALDSSSSPIEATIDSQVFVQVYNPYTKPIPPGASVEILIANRMRIQFGTGIVQPIPDYRESAVINQAIRPNEFAVVEFPVAQHIVTSPDSASDPRPQWSHSPSGTADQTSHVRFEFSWNGRLVDMHSRSPTISPGTRFAGMVRNSKRLSFNAEHYQVSRIPSHSSLNSNDLIRYVGDPRGTYLTSYDWGSTLSGTSSVSGRKLWYGRQEQSGNSPVSQDYVEWWVNRDYVRANANVGVSTGSLNITPAAISSNYDLSVDGLNAIAYIRNGPMQSIGELGNIYDPAQINDAGRAPVGGSPDSPYTSGGGRTLRIGYPEYEDATGELFNSEGMRAIELLDLFTVAEVNLVKETGYPQSTGKININTAPREVLEALVIGLGPTMDAGADSWQISEDGAAQIADSIVDARPFNRLSELAKISEQLIHQDNFTPTPADSHGLEVEWLPVMDYGREQIFSHFVEGITLQSRVFRVLIAGQALSATGDVRGEAIAEVLLVLEPPESETANPNDSLNVRTVAFRLLD